jgi:hypothetical protein
METKRPVDGFTLVCVAILIACLFLLAWHSWLLVPVFFESRPADEVRKLPHHGILQLTGRKAEDQEPMVQLALTFASFHVCRGIALGLHLIIIPFFALGMRKNKYKMVIAACALIAFADSLLLTVQLMGILQLVPWG